MEDKPKKQIARLKEILQDLGMSGRMSMEKAKAIRAKRELAEEIGPYASLGEGEWLNDFTEEVKQFEARRGLPKDQEGVKSERKRKQSLPENDSEDEGDLAANPPIRKKVCSRWTGGLSLIITIQNILAFLDDQSEEE
jgi:hypothetical protein